MRRTVRVAFEGDRGHRDDRTRREPLLELVVLCFTLGQREPPPVLVHHQVHVIRVVERLRRPIECRRVEAPLRRRGSPMSFVKSCRYLSYPATSLRREVVLVPPIELRLRRQR